MSGKERAGWARGEELNVASLPAVHVGHTDLEGARRSDSDSERVRGACYARRGCGSHVP